MKVKIIENLPLTGGCFSITFEWPMGGAKAGQFVMIRVSDGFDPLLRRPMSIADQANGTAVVIYKVVGRGTAILSQKKAGQWMDVSYPLGNAFNPPDDGKTIVLIGGGIGIAPLLFFANRNGSRKIIAMIGGASSNDILYAEKFAKACSEIIITTQDGSLGEKGVITDALPELSAVKKNSAYLLACGPPGMLQAVDSFCSETGIEGEISVEEKMGCGFGVCLGCMIETGASKKRVCVEGPVFKTGTVKW